VNFGLINSLHLMEEIFDLPELTVQFSAIVVKTAISIHIFSLLEIVTAQP
jgi:hypothetical protein